MNIIFSEEMWLHGSHITRLPVEMLSAIFKAGPIDAKNRLRFALDVSQVSYLWRQTAINTPFLWSSLILLAQCGEGWLELMKLMVKLSRSHPLDITVVDLIYLEGPEFYGALQWQLDIIIPEISRWKRIFYLGDFREDVFTFFEPLSLLSAPLLEVFDVQAGLDEDDDDDDDDDEYIDETLCVFAGGTPMLSRVYVTGIKLSSCLPPIVPLTSLRLSNSPSPIDFSLLKAILTVSTALTDIAIDAEVIDQEQLHEFAAEGQFFDLSSLRSLSISADIFRTNQLFNLLCVLRCPGVDTMTIASTSSSSPDTQSRCSCELPTYTSLRSLELCDVDGPWVCFDLDIMKLPALTHITFKRCPGAVTLLGAMVPAVEGKADIWPQLQVINLDEGSLWQHGHGSVDGLCKVLSYRTKRGKPVECVKFDDSTRQGQLCDCFEKACTYCSNPYHDTQYLD